jgi:DNA-binding Xre family transcriptional regulator
VIAAEGSVLAVYFVQAGHGGPIKIGLAKDVGCRVANMQTGNPKKLRVIGTIPAASEHIEAELHRRFQAGCVGGEWFAPSAELLNFIAEESSPWAADDRELLPARACRPPEPDRAPVETIDLSDMQRFDHKKMTALREAAGLTQLQACKRAGMTPSRWNDVESGKRVNLTLDTLARIAKALECESQDLLTTPKRRAN